MYSLNDDDHKKPIDRPWRRSAERKAEGKPEPVLDMEYMKWIHRHLDEIEALAPYEVELGLEMLRTYRAEGCRGDVGAVFEELDMIADHLEEHADNGWDGIDDAMEDLSASAEQSGLVWNGPGTGRVMTEEEKRDLEQRRSRKRAIEVYDRDMEALETFSRMLGEPIPDLISRMIGECQEKVWSAELHDYFKKQRGA